MSQTIGVATLRALCQESDEGRDPHGRIGDEKNEGAAVLPVTPS